MSQPKFQIPYVEMGMTVNWHPDPEAAPIPAIVTMVGNDTINVNVIHQDLANFVVKSGCRHRKDPRNIRSDDRDSGFWSHTPFMMKVMTLIKAFENEETLPIGPDPDPKKAA